MDVPPLGTVPTLITWVVPLGSVMVAVVPVAALGPALVTITLTVMVAPGVALAGAVIVMAKSAIAFTAKEAVTVAEFAPSEVVNEPAAIVLVTVPANKLVTTAVIVQLEPCGIKVPTGSDSDEPLATAVADPKKQPVVVVTAGEALTNPPGYASMNAFVRVAETSGFVLLIVIVNKAVDPALMVLGEKLFETAGLESPTVSVSDAVQV